MKSAGINDFRILLHENQSALIQQQQFILKQDDVINTHWLRTLNPLIKNVEGRVVWSNLLQKGIMEFVGLPKLKNHEAYQLWIYDLIGETNKPIFAKEFSDSNTGSLLIPFAAKELITLPFKFELLLKSEDQSSSQPLFLAQP